MDFGDGGVNVSACVEVFRVEAADCPCGLSGGVVYVALCFHRLSAVGAEPCLLHEFFSLTFVFDVVSDHSEVTSIDSTGIRSGSPVPLHVFSVIRVSRLD